MRLLSINVPSELAASGQAIYGTIGVGASTALLSVASGWLYAQLGAYAFLLMSMLCLIMALPPAGWASQAFKPQVFKPRPRRGTTATNFA
jgi:MFS transporter, PPP family, 3-phenylpropionic acid transporter